MKIEITPDPNAEDFRALKKGMRDFELSVFPHLPDESEDIPFYAFAKDENDQVIGGIKATIFWNGLEIETLWVAPEYRRQGIASCLMSEAEKLAVQQGAVISYLKTVLAKEFYEKLGYSVYGVLEDRPIGSLLYHMKKRLVLECSK
jgi:ribosomal protein S18 acetylase RimI-like enzyme